MPRLFERDVFLGGQEGAAGKPCYRIPTLALAPDGSLLAFAEGRETPQDPGSGLPISMNCKRSTDQGRTWGPLQVLAGDPDHSYSDPRVVVDAAKKRVFIFYTQWPVKIGAEQAPTGVGPVRCGVKTRPASCTQAMLAASRRGKPLDASTRASPACPSGAT